MAQHDGDKEKIQFDNNKIYIFSVNPPISGRIYTRLDAWSKGWKDCNISLLAMPLNKWEF